MSRPSLVALSRAVTALPHSLRRLAEAYGVAPEYWTAFGDEKVADPEALAFILRELGASLDADADVEAAADAALRERHKQIWLRTVEPCVVSWDGKGVHLLIRHEAVRHEAPYAGAVVFEDGHRLELSGRLCDLETVDQSEVDGAAYQQRRLAIDEQFPVGYHRVELEVDGQPCTTHVLSAPWTCFDDEPGARRWGAFAPLYALRSARSDRFGGADFTDLRALLGWVADRGGRVVGTLPLLSTYLDEPCDYSPYAPVSKRFWNELFVDIGELPELERSAEARELLASDAFGFASRVLADADRVDYRGLMAHRRAVLELCARAAFATDSPRREAIDRFVAERPDVADYARFRAFGEQRGADWTRWPEAARDGALAAADVDQDRYRYHVYVQFAAGQQLAALGALARERDMGLYLDLPVGVHPSGYDAWREQALFVDGATIGAPPDALFIGGQDWGVPALHPERSRAQGHAYLRDSIRAHCEHAGVLRIDHVMGLFRLYWVPRGYGAKEGVYVHYPQNELYAIVSIESHRNRCVVVGEDLGTVPDQVREQMTAHGLHGMHVAQFALSSDASAAVGPPAPGTVASINTHDTPTFAGFWQSKDTDDRIELGLIDDAAAFAERAGRDQVRKALVDYLRTRESAGAGEDDQAVVEGILAELASSDAWLTLVTLEDLWLESDPQNVPGTSYERDNWRRKMRYAFDEFDTLDRVTRVLADVNRRRAR